MIYEPSFDTLDVKDMLALRDLHDFFVVFKFVETKFANVPGLIWRIFEFDLLHNP